MRKFSRARVCIHSILAYMPLYSYAVDSPGKQSVGGSHEGTAYKTEEIAVEHFLKANGISLCGETLSAMIRRYAPKVRLVTPPLSEAGEELKRECETDKQTPDDSAQGKLF